jgi:hypothetical protein
MDVAVPVDVSTRSPLQELYWQRAALEQHIVELQNAAKAQSEEVNLLRSKELIMINVAMIDGSMVECNISEYSTVQDLLDFATANDTASLHNVDKAHANIVGLDLLTDNGVVMEKHAMLTDYNLVTGSSVTMLIRRFFNGCYECWVKIDTSCPTVPRSDKFTLHITDDMVSINDNNAKSIVNDNTASGGQVSVEFKRPILLRSDLPHSRATFQVTGCEFEHRSGDLSKPWWYPLEGKLLGTSSSGTSSLAFKGRLLDH